MPGMGGMMNRGGAQQPGMGGQPGGGGAAGNMMNSMFNQPSGQGRFSRDPYSNYGMGQQPGQMSPRITRLMQQCSAGDGNACNQLQIAQMQQQDSMNQWNQEYSNRSGMAREAYKPMGARRGW